MTSYRLTIRDVVRNEVLTIYTRWLEFAQVKEDPEPEVYVAFSPGFERIWLESRKRFPEYMEQKPANTGLRSQYSLRLYIYSWAKKYVEDGARTISLEELDGCSAWSRSRIRREMSLAKPTDYTRLNHSWAWAAGGAISNADDLATWI
jgi:hypothetical protein